MSLAQGFPNTFSATQQTQEVLKNTDNETKKIYTDINSLMSVGGHAHTGNGSDGAKISISGIVIDSALNEALGTPIASASTINITTATGNFLHIKGTTTITEVTLGVGMRREVIFDGILILTHHATKNNLPSGANITTAVGDRATYISDGTTVYCTKYQRADGKAIVSGSITSGGEILQLRIFNNVSTPNTKMDITANNVPLYDTSYNQAKSGVISLTADLGVSGANGLDTGSKANSTNYYLWVIGKEDGTIASLWSLSATTPTLPTGYIYKRLVGWNRTDSSGNLSKIVQLGNKSRYIPSGLTASTNYPVMSSGTQGTISSSVYTPVSITLTNFIPSNAIAIDVLIDSQTTAISIGASPSINFSGYGTAYAPPIYVYFGTYQNNMQGNIRMETANTIYWASSGSAGLLKCVGWEVAL